ncbi:MAG: glycosyltransferase family 2 protein [Gemmatimonadales bacterium]
MDGIPVGVSYVLPLKTSVPLVTREFSDYLAWLAPNVGEVIVVDASPPDVFAIHHESWGSGINHVPPTMDLATPMGKVGNVLTGARLARFDRLVIADDDVRYDAASLAQVASALVDADIVRPQNYFDPLPWHARWDTGRMLLNRSTGGDWPGTIGVRLDILRATGGYDGRALFENLELVRTVLAAGGNERVLLGAYVRRRPSTTSHFWSQRVRQAYDEIARPARLAIQLAILPAVGALAVTGHWVILAVLVAGVVGLAEVGRWRAGGRRFFPVTGSLFAPLWVAERAVCSWIAVASRVFLGGVPYRGTILRHAATPLHKLQARYENAHTITSADHTPRRQSA